MPEMDGATATRHIRERHPEIRVIALTSFKEDDLVQGVLAAGAIGYLLKKCRPKNSSMPFARPTWAAHLGARSRRVLIHTATQPREQPLGHDLTERERESSPSW